MKTPTHLFLQYNMLALPVLHESSLLQRGYYIRGRNGQVLAQVPYAKGRSWGGAQPLQQSLLPVRPVGDQAEV